MEKRIALSSQQLQNNLLDKLYFAPHEQNGWKTFLSQLVQFSKSRSARLLALNTEGEVVNSVQVNTDDAAYQAYVEHFVHLCPWRTELPKKAKGQLYSTYLDFSCDQKNFYQSEFFNDWARPLDIHHGACGSILTHNGLTFQLMLQRTEQQGYYCREEMQLINNLLPHVRRSLHLEDIVRQQQLHNAACGAAMLLNSQNQVIYLSPEAHHKLSTLSELVLQGRYLHFLPKRKHHALYASLHNPNVHPRPAGGSIKLEDGSQLLVMPLHPETDNDYLFPAQAHTALYFLESTNTTPCIDPAQLRQLLKLSASEAHIASLLAQGKTTEDIACLRSVSVQTVRTQLKSIFKKTGAGNQMQLSNLVLRLAATVKT